MLRDLDTSSAKVAFDLSLDALPDKLFDLLTCTMIINEHALEGIVLEKKDIPAALAKLPVRTYAESELYRSIRNLRTNIEYMFYLLYPELDLTFSQIATYNEAFASHPIVTAKKSKSNRKTSSKNANSTSSPVSRILSDRFFLLQSNHEEDISLTQLFKQNPTYRNRPSTPGTYHLNVIPIKAIESALSALFEDYQQNLTTLHPVETAAHLHYHFMRIFPYDETTGFIGRLLVNTHLMWCHCPPAIISSSDRQDYFQALGGPYTALIDLYIRGIRYSEKLCKRLFHP